MSGRRMGLGTAGLGAGIGVLGRRLEGLEETVGAIRAAGGQAALASADVREPEAVARAFDVLEGQLGPANQLVNNAAGNFLAPSEELSPHPFNSVEHSVLFRRFPCTRGLCRPLIHP